MLTRRQRDDRRGGPGSKPPRPPAKPATPRVEDYLTVDPMEVEIGVGLIRLADPKRGGDLLERIARVRQNVAADIGLIMPKVRIRDNMRLEQNQYRIKIADMPVAEGKIYPGMLLAIGNARTTTGRVGRLGHARAGWQTCRPRGSSRRHATRPRSFGYTRRRAGQRAGHPPDRRRPQACRRNPHPRRHEASGRRTEEIVAGRGRGADSRPDEAGRSAAGFATVAARAGADSPVGTDPRNAGRVCPAHQGSRRADRIRAIALARAISTRYRDAENRLHVSRSTSARRRNSRCGRADRRRVCRADATASRSSELCEIGRLGRGATLDSRSHGGRAGQPANPTGRATLDRLAAAAAGGAELQRDHARHARRGRRAHRPGASRSLRRGCPVQGSLTVRSAESRQPRLP